MAINVCPSAENRVGAKYEFEVQSKSEDNGTPVQRYTEMQWKERM